MTARLIYHVTKKGVLNKLLRVEHVNCFYSKAVICLIKPVENVQNLHAEQNIKTAVSYTIILLAYICLVPWLVFRLTPSV